MPVNRLTVGGRNAPWRQLAWFEPETNSGRHPIYAGPCNQGLALSREQTRSLGQDFTDQKIGIPGGRSRPETGTESQLRRASAC